MIHSPLTHEASQWEVKDLLTDASWDWNRIHFDLPIEIKLIIQAISMSIVGGGRDKLAWTGNPRGMFDLKSAYSLAKEADTMHPINASWICKSETLPKIKTFL